MSFFVNNNFDLSRAGFGGFTQLTYNQMLWKFCVYIFNKNVQNVGIILNNEFIFEVKILDQLDLLRSTY